MMHVIEETFPRLLANSNKVVNKGRDSEFLDHSYLFIGFIMR